MCVILFGISLSLALSPITADDMGLGKTLTTISLMLDKKQEDRSTVKRVTGGVQSSLVLLLFRMLLYCLLFLFCCCLPPPPPPPPPPSPSQDRLSTPGTLVVVPASLMNMWEAEVASKVRGGYLRVKIYHGSSRPKDPAVLVIVHCRTRWFK